MTNAELRWDEQDLIPAIVQDADTGQVLWEYTLPTARRGGFAIANGALYFSNGIPGALQMGGGPSWNPREMVQKARNIGTYSVYCFTVDGR